MEDGIRVYRGEVRRAVVAVLMRSAWLVMVLVSAVRDEAGRWWRRARRDAEQAGEDEHGERHRGGSAQ